MHYVIIDLEATCWEKGTSPGRMEIIEMGAVLLGSSTGPVLRTFGEFVRPVESPTLSDFCRQLTSIRQEEVDQAEPFPKVLPRLLEWIGPEPYALCSWGAYDLGQLRVDCQRHGIPLPAGFERHVNLKKEYSRLRNVQPTGMKGALLREGIPLEGTHHRGADDARNIAKLALLILPGWESRSPAQDASIHGIPPAG
jgi:inhibitor of KinA sporulation pathway (predicted exonuclease)